ncbi:hypothetical protein ACFE04_018961 [Oxalis oulophora]
MEIVEELNEIIEDSYEGLDDSSEFSGTNQIVQDSYEEIVEDSYEGLDDSPKFSETSQIFKDSYEVVQDSVESKESKEDTRNVKESLVAEVSNMKGNITKKIDKNIGLNASKKHTFDLNKFPDEELEEDTYEEKEIKRTIRAMLHIFFPNFY